MGVQTLARSIAVEPPPPQVAIDRQAIVDTLWLGRTRVPAGLRWEYYGAMFQADWKVPEYDPKLAQKLLKEAGYKGDPIPFRVLQNYYTNQVSTAQIVVEMWKAVGLNVQIQMRENWQQIFETGSQRGVRDIQCKAAQAFQMDFRARNFQLAKA